MPRKPVHPSARRRVAHACENCQRRKQKCDGLFPCGTCVKRNLPNECHFSKPSPRSPQHSDSSQWLNLPTTVSPGSDEGFGKNDTLSSETSSQAARLIQDPQGHNLFLGDSSNFYFLQALRRIVEKRIGPCELVEDQLRFSIVEPSSDDDHSYDDDEQWLLRHTGDGHESPEIRTMIDQYIACTRGILDILDDEFLHSIPNSWQGHEQNVLNNLVLAIGALNSSEPLQSHAARLYARARHFSEQNLSREPSLESICAHALLAFYLLCKSRRNAAFMTLGVAIRGCYSLGLHQQSISRHSPSNTPLHRERIWSVVRTLDLHLSASLGRPPSTSFSDSRGNIEHVLLDTILLRFYSKQNIDTSTLERVVSQFKSWADQLATTKPLLSQDPASAEVVDAIQQHLAYFHAIILMVRPFLLRSVVSHTHASRPAESCTSNESDRSRAFLHGSIDAALQIISLSQTLLHAREMSRHLPLNIYHIFLAALTLGCAVFGGLAPQFPLLKNIQLAHNLLCMFPHDHIAVRNASIVEKLISACDAFLQKRSSPREDQDEVMLTTCFEDSGSAVFATDVNIGPEPLYNQNVGVGSVASDMWSGLGVENAWIDPSDTWWDDVFASTYSPSLTTS